MQSSARWEQWSGWAEHQAAMSQILRQVISVDPKKSLDITGVELPRIEQPRCISVSSMQSSIPSSSLMYDDEARTCGEQQPFLFVWFPRIRKIRGKGTDAANARSCSGSKYYRKIELRLK